MKIKVSELSGVELDYWVAMCVYGKAQKHATGVYGIGATAVGTLGYIRFDHTNWADCGPLIERFDVKLLPPGSDISIDDTSPWAAYVRREGERIRHRGMFGDTPPNSNL